MGLDKSGAGGIFHRVDEHARELAGHMAMQSDTEEKVKGLIVQMIQGGGGKLCT
jgi:hypothetical protein